MAFSNIFPVYIYRGMVLDPIEQAGLVLVGKRLYQIDKLYPTQLLKFRLKMNLGQEEERKEWIKGGKGGTREGRRKKINRFCVIFQALLNDFNLLIHLMPILIICHIISFYIQGNGGPERFQLKCTQYSHDQDSILSFSDFRIYILHIKLGQIGWTLKGRELMSGYKLRLHDLKLISVYGGG